MLHAIHRNIYHKSSSIIADILTFSKQKLRPSLLSKSVQVNAVFHSDLLLLYSRHILLRNTDSDKARHEIIFRKAQNLSCMIRLISERDPKKKKVSKKVDLAAKLFDEYGPKYAERHGGYTRIVKIGQRKGDAAMEVVLELV